ncbi:hypothetical protein EVAR_22075_1 [Eumeta japonica]|uniref:Uncharacterized protein n=1 Tax=Eumeta variegata TaxID=151549 RepID=A0A4C1USL3_EUMVA|nr:hypothetical protein EVAR_22075_1 [Eumeta japonica]
MEPRSKSVANGIERGATIGINIIGPGPPVLLNLKAVAAEYDYKARRNCRSSFNDGCAGSRPRRPDLDGDCIWRAAARPAEAMKRLRRFVLSDLIPYLTCCEENLQSNNTSKKFKESKSGAAGPGAGAVRKQRPPLDLFGKHVDRALTRIRIPRAFGIARVRRARRMRPAASTELHFKNFSRFVFEL